MARNDEETIIEIRPNPIKDVLKNKKSKEKVKNTKSDTREIYLKTYGLLCTDDSTGWSHELYEKLNLWDRPHSDSYKWELAIEIMEFIRDHVEDIKIKDHYLPPSRPSIPFESDGSIDAGVLAELIERTKSARGIK